MASTLVPVAADHFQQLHDKLEHHVECTDASWAALLKELFRVHFCLASFGVCERFMNDSELQNLYGSRVLQFLRDYPDEHGDLVREAFRDDRALDSAVGYYIHGQVTVQDRQAIEHFRALKGNIAESYLSNLCDKVCARTAHVLGVVYGDPASMFLILTNTGSLIAAAELFHGLKPVLTDEEMRAYTEESRGFLKRAVNRLFH